MQYINNDTRIVATSVKFHFRQVLPWIVFGELLHKEKTADSKNTAFSVPGSSLFGERWYRVCGRLNALLYKRKVIMHSP